MPGPLPQPTRRRTNAPTIPTTNLPAAGRQGPPPRVPPGVKLGKTGKAWWRWAWSTPQAAAWASGHEAVVARRAALEDDLATLGQVENLDILDLIDARDASELKALIRGLAALATGRLQLMKEMRELDDRLGLTPKGMAALRWTITGEGEATPLTPVADLVTSDRWRRSAAG